jgi:hypothetical protein
MGQQPVTEVPARLVEDPVGLRSDDAVDGQSPLLLEGPDRPVHLRVEDHLARRRTAAVGQQAERGQQSADVGDRVAGVAETEEPLMLRQAQDLILLVETAKGGRPLGGRPAPFQSAVTLRR